MWAYYSRLAHAAGSSYVGGRPLAMDKSASRALSDAEAEEAADAQVSIGDFHLFVSHSVLPTARWVPTALWGPDHLSGVCCWSKTSRNPNPRLLSGDVSSTGGACAAGRDRGGGKGGGR